jgi:hypothetical protein
MIGAPMWFACQAISGQVALQDIGREKSLARGRNTALTMAFEQGLSVILGALGDGVPVPLTVICAHRSDWAHHWSR